ncbi:hypothetical protein T4B_13908 [Trichinella pseudospiralis]|uniref:Uncharacterized protein n=2 Tax=Trichinella pseudospiralis TaxID=6337 RepID=A0A0V1EPX9_TRIPS|nr:hypothetical protein T4A_8876 [Trichinella pseudospiralis]KRY87543.1 hypothetical protein T4D_6740 [Trichinella pseudospiralis]KRZ20826.1 hypothetical protein T4B_13908 [Trichinella pseudospiralis]KRZ30224.1 hypothetical protein T4C_3568 [Trichinella pseudospiralis]
MHTVDCTQLTDNSRNQLFRCFAFVDALHCFSRRYVEIELHIVRALWIFMIRQEYTGGNIFSSEIVWQGGSELDVGKIFFWNGHQQSITNE